jgi:hypothetical protein
MKKFIVFILLFSFSSIVFSEEQKTDYTSRLKFYQAEKIAGIVLTCVGGSSFIAGITWGIIFQIDPANTPGSVYLGSSGGSYYATYFYLNVPSLCFNLTGIICLAIGIPLTIVGAVREKKTRKLMENAFNKIIPELNVDMLDKSVFIGAKIIL